MKRRELTCSLVCILTLAATLIAGGAVASTMDEKDVRAANAQFYAALNKMFTGDVAPMKEVWAHSPTVTYMGPNGGILVGWNQVQDIWEKQAAMKLGGTVNPEDIRVTVGSDLAVVSAYEKGENTNADGKTATVSIRATNLFAKDGGKWRMIGHHTDLLPYLAK